MVFSSITFLFMFLPLALIAYYTAPKSWRNMVILVLSLFFYAWGEPVYVFLMIGSIVLDYFGGLLIQHNRKDKNKQTFIFVTVLVLNLSVLVFFKYYGFIIANINSVLGTTLQIRELPLPLGISFYTFQLISYIADVYMGKVRAQKNIINFGAYISMFPQLVAGPIVQYSDVEQQLMNREESIYKFGEGAERFICGLGKKVLLANNLGLIWREIKVMPTSDLSVVTAWVGIIAFTLQIYFDFSGYSDMAIGLGKIMGFEFLENFKHPYMSRSISEFWRRWHISLGSWFRDYIYIPLGGNRRGIVVQLRNLIIVWFATGLWHGASWNFIVWGLYFGALIFLEKVFLGGILAKVPAVIAHGYTLIAVVVSWVFFEAVTVGGALDYIGVMFGLAGNPVVDGMARYSVRTNFIILTVAILAATPLIRGWINKLKTKYDFSGVVAVVLCNLTVLFIATAYLVSESYNPFLYFRF
ncbi:MAG: MBOAT family O-acyltransferase [Clostridium sp.]